MKRHTPKCNLLKSVNDRFKSAAKEFAELSGHPSDEEKYIKLSHFVQRRVYDRLRKVFIWEDHRFVDFDRFTYFSTNLLVQIEAKRMQSIAHNYRQMLLHMRDSGLISISDHYCHDHNSPFRFCKAYTINTTVLKSAIDTIHSVQLDTVDIPETELKELEELAKEAKKIEWVEYGGLKMHFDIDGAMRHLSDDFTKCQKDKFCLSFAKMKCALIAWIDRNRDHKDRIVDFRNFHFLTSMPKAALYHIYDEKGRRFHEVIDLPSGNILTTALSMYNSGTIPETEYLGILRGIFKKEDCGSTYDQFISDTNCTFSRNFVKKCFQIVINCSDRQMSAHERKASAYHKNPSNIHLQTSKCVVDIQSWLMDKYPNFGDCLRNFDCTQSTHFNKEVKGTYYAFTFIEKNIIEDIQFKLKDSGNTIRIHDAIWGFEDFGNCSKVLKGEIKKLSTTNRISFTRDMLDVISSNKVSRAKFVGGGSPPKRRILVA